MVVVEVVVVVVEEEVIVVVVEVVIVEEEEVTEVTIVTELATVDVVRLAENHLVFFSSFYWLLVSSRFHELIVCYCC